MIVPGLLLAILFCWATAMSSALADSPIQVQVLRGEGANNNAVTGGSVSPVVRVVDANGSPVSDALVVFSAAELGPRVEFSGFGSAVSTLTDDSGAAAAPGLRPVGENGPVEIRVVASKNGEFANTVIRQMNVGVGAEGAGEQELNIVLLPPPDRPGARKVKPSNAQVRVEDGKGRPVSGATVNFSLRKRAGDDSSEIAAATAPSMDDGSAVGPILPRSGRAHLELMIRAEIGGRCATRYFQLP